MLVVGLAARRGVVGRFVGCLLWEAGDFESGKARRGKLAGTNVIT